MSQQIGEADSFSPDKPFKRFSTHSRACEERCRSVSRQHMRAQTHALSLSPTRGGHGRREKIKDGNVERWARWQAKHRQDGAEKEGMDTGGEGHITIADNTVQQPTIPCRASIVALPTPSHRRQVYHTLSEFNDVRCTGLPPSRP